MEHVPKERVPDVQEVEWPRPRSTSIRVEFYGVVRAQVGQADTTLDVAPEGTTLGQVLDGLCQRFPGLKGLCQPDGGLSPAYLANVGGRRFVRDPCVRILPGESLLILSADAGG